MGPPCLGAGNSTPSLVFRGMHVCMCMGAEAHQHSTKVGSLSPQMCLFLTQSTSFSEQERCWMGRWAPWILDLTFLAPGVGVGQLHASHLQPCLPQRMWGFCGFLFSPLLFRECLNHWQL